MSKSFSKEFKEKTLKRLQPPENKSVKELAEEEDIPKTTIYTWISKARKKGQLIPNSKPARA